MATNKSQDSLMKFFRLVFLCFLIVLYLYQQNRETVENPSVASETKRILSSKSQGFAFKSVQYFNDDFHESKTNFKFNLTPTTTLGDLIEHLRNNFIIINKNGEREKSPRNLYRIRFKNNKTAGVWEYLSEWLLGKWNVKSWHWTGKVKHLWSPVYTDHNLVLSDLGVTNDQTNIMLFVNMKMMEYNCPYRQLAHKNDPDQGWNWFDTVAQDMNYSDSLPAAKKMDFHFNMCTNAWVPPNIRKLGHKDLGKNWRSSDFSADNSANNTKNPLYYERAPSESGKILKNFGIYAGEDISFTDQFPIRPWDPQIDVYNPLYKKSAKQCVDLDKWRHFPEYKTANHMAKSVHSLGVNAKVVLTFNSDYKLNKYTGMFQKNQSVEAWIRFS